MSYTAKEFGKELERELSQGYDVVRIARSAFRIYHEHVGEIDPVLKQRMFQVIAMEEGPEFELSEEELRHLASQLTEELRNDSPFAS